MISMDWIVFIATLALIVVVLGMYWLPSIIGYVRHAPGMFAVVVTNALLGWTIIGWAVSLSMALKVRDPA
jgi:RsiW-degrading membrane proteinase PrsW (M82 family)